MTREEMINDIIRMLQDLERIGLKKTTSEKCIEQYIHIGAGLTVCFFYCVCEFRSHKSTVRISDGCTRGIVKHDTLKEAKDAISAHCKGVGNSQTPIAGGIQKMKFISEGEDFYILDQPNEICTSELGLCIQRFFVS